MPLLRENKSLEAASTFNTLQTTFLLLLYASMKQWPCFTSDWNGCKCWGAARAASCRDCIKQIDASLNSPKSVVIYSLIKRHPKETSPSTCIKKLLIMQSVMFNSKHISVSKDTLHSHEILRKPPEAKIASSLSQKDQKNEITHQRTSRAAVYLLDPLISCCNATAYSVDRAWPARMWRELMLATWSYRANTGGLQEAWHWQIYSRSGDQAHKQHRLSASTAALLVHIRCKLDLMNGMAFACARRKYHGISHSGEMKALTLQELWLTRRAQMRNS